MRTLIIGILLFASTLTMISDNLSITLGWDPSSTYGFGVDGYKVHSGITTNQSPSPINTVYNTNGDGSISISKYYGIPLTPLKTTSNTTSVVVDNLSTDTTHCFAVSVYDAYGVESELSNEVIFRINSYTNSGPPPKSSFDISSYVTNWFETPSITTNRNNGTVSTNFYTVTPHTFQFSADLYVNGSWEIESSTNLAQSNWFTVKSGSDSIPTITVTNNGGIAFFRLKL